MFSDFLSELCCDDELVLSVLLDFESFDDDCEFAGGFVAVGDCVGVSGDFVADDDEPGDVGPVDGRVEAWPDGDFGDVELGDVDGRCVGSASPPPSAWPPS